MTPTLRDIQGVMNGMGISLPKKVWLSKAGKKAAALYREKYFRNPPRIPVVVYGREFQVYAYRPEENLLVLEAIIRTLEEEYHRRDDQALLMLRSLQEDYDLLMLGILQADSWKHINGPNLRPVS